MHICIYIHTYAIYVCIHVHIRCDSTLPTKMVLSITAQIHRGNVHTRFCLRESILTSFSSDAHTTIYVTSLTFLLLHPGNMLEKKDLLFNVPAVKCEVHSNLMWHLNSVQNPPSVSYFHMFIGICMRTASISHEHV